MSGMSDTFGSSVLGVHKRRKCREFARKLTAAFLCPPRSRLQAGMQPRTRHLQPSWGVQVSPTSARSTCGEVNEGPRASGGGVACVFGPSVRPPPAVCVCVCERSPPPSAIVLLPVLNTDSKVSSSVTPTPPPAAPISSSSLHPCYGWNAGFRRATTGDPLRRFHAKTQKTSTESSRWVRRL